MPEEKTVEGWNKGVLQRGNVRWDVHRHICIRMIGLGVVGDLPQRNHLVRLLRAEKPLDVHHQRLPAQDVHVLEGVRCTRQVRVHGRDGFQFRRAHRTHVRARRLKRRAAST